MAQKASFSNKKISITYHPIQIPKELTALVQVWNDTLPSTFKMTSELLRPHLDMDPNWDPAGCIGAYANDKDMIGFVIGKRWKIPMSELAQSEDGRWMRDSKMGIGMICVLPTFQKQKIGTELMHQVESFFKANDGALSSIGREPGKHLFPGIPQPLEDSYEFFDKLGYGKLGMDTTIDIFGDIRSIEDPPKNNPKLAEKNAANRKEEFDVIGYSPPLKDAVLNFSKANFSGKWYWTIKTFIENPNVALDEVQLLVKNEKKKMVIAGFAVTASQASVRTGVPTIMQSNGRKEFGGLGPIGIGKDYRGSKGLGAMLLHFALFNLKKKGVTTVLIDWTSHGLLQRYYGPAGFKLYMNYVSISKEFE